MSDDPTTTGPVRIGGTDNLVAAFRRARAIPGANVIEHSEFTLDFKGDLIFTVSNNALTISLQIGPPDAPGYRMDFPPRSLNEFETDADLNDYLDAVKRNFMALVRPRLTQEAFSSLQVLILGLYYMMNPGTGGRDFIIESYLEQARGLLESMLAELPPRQKPGTWSKIALRNAVADAAFRLIQRGMKGRTLTLDAVRDEMHTQFGDHTPASGEALRKQLEERGLNWRPIKREAEKFAEAVAAGQAVAQKRSAENPKPEAGEPLNSPVSG